jgi:SAM-dependent methyltransferase
MAPAEHFPLYFPGDARRAFGADDVCLRIAHTAGWSNGSRLLELGAGSAGLFITQKLGCHATVADPDERALGPMRERSKTPPASERITVKVAPYDKLPFGDEEFDGILMLGLVALPASVAVKTLRRHLATKGRLALTYPVKVGRAPAKAALDFWGARLGEPLLYPRELLMLFEKAGYEPETLETLSDADLDVYYRDLEAALAKQPAEAAAQVKVLRDELELHRAQAGKASVTFALAVGRRKEPGEKPPASRDGG